MAVGMYLRGLFTKDTGWDAFVKGRNSRLKMSQQLDQYRYVTGKFDEYVGMKTSADVAGAAGVTINKTQVMKAFNLPVSWAEEGLEALALTGMYGPGGSRSEDAKVVAMLDEVPPTTTGIQLKKFLSLLREIHSRWTIEHP
ncbi:uncharacterized protein C8Q71DRAFT_798740 [Rhodofomes roseus]|uniref:Uncharacterized protein n=1 Tax=Rhodofomes roseus TaxID=34475 RepID=A0ABQ8K5S0_9APHY|nr:uncharacterized protein C8Q71DRAFT_798740 [Rhodofomes roseus]KAH9832317.1 hypothetical protein C8Q71DRAFT_798740 [Rhodofomes roseus]